MLITQDSVIGADSFRIDELKHSIKGKLMREMPRIFNTCFHVL